MSSYTHFALGDLVLESGSTLRNARLAYRTFGSLAADRSNAILLPSFITGTHDGYLPFIGPGRCFDPDRHFIIATNLFGNGLSTSPSDCSEDQTGPAFPVVSVRDNVRAQYRLVTEGLGVDRLSLVGGYSMGAQQAFQWAVSYPDRVAHLATWCGHARTTPHTRVFLGSLRMAIENSADWQGGLYRTPPRRALQALARIYAPWGLSQAWYRQELWQALGFPNLEALLTGFWEAAMAGLEANDFLAQLDTWGTHDVGTTGGFDGNWKRALAGITAKTAVMPSSTDLYFPVEDARVEASCIPGAHFVPIESDWGHFAGVGLDSSASALIDSTISSLMS